MADEKILKDEQLDEVAGGTYQESYDEMFQLATQLGVNFDSYSRDNSVNKLGGMYDQVGIRFVAHNSDINSNEYYIKATGQRIDRATAFGHLFNAVRNHQVIC